MCLLPFCQAFLRVALFLPLQIIRAPPPAETVFADPFGCLGSRAIGIQRKGAFFPIGFRPAVEAKQKSRSASRQLTGFVHLTFFERYLRI